MIWKTFQAQQVCFWTACSSEVKVTPNDTSHVHTLWICYSSTLCLVSLIQRFVTPIFSRLHVSALKDGQILWNHAWLILCIAVTLGCWKQEAELLLLCVCAPFAILSRVREAVSQTFSERQCHPEDLRRSLENGRWNNHLNVFLLMNCLLSVVQIYSFLVFHCNTDQPSPMLFQTGNFVFASFSKTLRSPNVRIFSAFM